jgi:hypothetical protein
MENNPNRNRTSVSVWQNDPNRSRALISIWKMILIGKGRQSVYGKMLLTGTGQV